MTKVYFNKLLKASGDPADSLNETIVHLWVNGEVESFLIARAFTAPSKQLGELSFTIIYESNEEAKVGKVIKIFPFTRSFKDCLLKLGYEWSRLDN